MNRTPMLSVAMQKVEGSSPFSRLLAQKLSSRR